MQNKQFGDFTIKEVFEKAFGKDSAEQILAEIQHEYNQGARGVDLMSKADAVVAKYSIGTRDSTTDNLINLGATAISTGTFAMVVIA